MRSSVCATIIACLTVLGVDAPGGEFVLRLAPAPPLLTQVAPIPPSLEVPDAGPEAALAAGPLACSEWRWANPLPQGNTIRNITYGNGLFVTVGEAGTVMTSPDGLNWTVGHLPVSSAGRVKWVGSQFLATAPNEPSGSILASVDATTWVVRNVGVQRPIHGFASHGSTIAAVGGGGAVLTSSDGVIWTQRESGTTKSLYAVGWVGNCFVAVGSEGAFLKSPDGTTWTAYQMTMGSIVYLRNLFGVFSNGSVTLVLTQDGVFTSSDLETFARTNGLYALDACWGDGRFVVVGETRVSTSTDGTAWLDATVPAINDNYRSVAWGAGRFVATLYWEMMSSADGFEWSEVSYSATAQSDYTYLSGLAVGGGRHVAVGYPEMIIFSDDGGARWQPAASAGSSARLQAVAYGNGRFVAVGDDGEVRVATDVQDWESINSNTTDDLYGVTWTGERFVAVGTNGRVFTSGDGSSWSSQTSGTFHHLYDVTSGGGVTVAVGRSGTIVTSADGSQWTGASQSVGSLWSVTWAKGLFVAVGDGIVLSSPDGREWTQQWAEASRSVYAVAGGPRGFVALLNGSQLVSPDGITWTTATMPAEYQPYGAVLSDGQQYVAAGDNRIVRTWCGQAARVPRRRIGHP